MSPYTELATPIGLLCFFVKIGNWAQIEHVAFEDIAIAELRPQLPSGMSVASCHSVVLTVRSPLIEEHDLEFFAHWRSPFPPKLSVESGQDFQASSWASSTHMVMVGTESRGVLEARLRGRVQFVPSQFEPVLHTSKSMVIRVERVEPNAETTFHFVVAVNPLPEPVVGSCRHAVDHRHRFLLLHA